MNSSRLAVKYNTSLLLKFVIPSIIMQLFLAFYVIVDGVFVSHFLGDIALSCINITLPIIYFESALAIMLSVGSSAIVAKFFGENKAQKARSLFSALFLIVVTCGFIVFILGSLFNEQIINLLGASSEQFDLSMSYSKTILYFAPFYFLQFFFQTYFITAGKPHIALILTISAGVSNIILDYIFLGILHSSISGAALATGLSYTIMSIGGIINFSLNRRNSLYFVKPKIEIRQFFKIIENGSSEFVANISFAISTIFFNYLFLKYYGTNGVAAITIVLYLQFIFAATFVGYSNAVAPIISYKFGAADYKQLNFIVRQSLIVITFFSISIFTISLIFLPNLLQIFTTNTYIIQITEQNFILFAISFLFMGFNIFMSSLFTALSNGRISAIISFSRTLIILVFCLITLPFLFGTTGLWIAISITEFLAVLISFAFYFLKKNYYNF